MNFTIFTLLDKWKPWRNIAFGVFNAKLGILLTAEAENILMRGSCYKTNSLIHFILYKCNKNGAKM